MWLNKAAWGKGYATEGARALVRKWFAELGVQRVTADTMSVNSLSRRVMEKVGLVYVRTWFGDWPESIEGPARGSRVRPEQGGVASGHGGLLTRRRPILRAAANSCRIVCLS